MIDFLLNLFNTNGFPARWDCGTWTPAHGWLHVVSDLAIFGAYAAIPFVLAWFILRRKDVPFLPIFWLFVAFIFLCGLGHLVESTLFWHPWYRLSGLVKLLTAAVSWLTVVSLVRYLPAALSLPGLAKISEQLQSQAVERETAKAHLRERTLALEQMNAELSAVSRMAVGREDRVIQLKQEVNSLLQRLGEQPRYLLQSEPVI